MVDAIKERRVSPSKTAYSLKTLWPLPYFKRLVKIFLIDHEYVTRKLSEQWIFIYYKRIMWPRLRIDTILPETWSAHKSQWCGAILADSVMIKKHLARFVYVDHTNDLHRWRRVLSHLIVKKRVPTLDNNPLFPPSPQKCKWVEKRKENGERETGWTVDEGRGKNNLINLIFSHHYSGDNYGIDIKQCDALYTVCAPFFSKLRNVRMTHL